VSEEVATALQEGRGVVAFGVVLIGRVCPRRWNLMVAQECETRCEKVDLSRHDRGLGGRVVVGLNALNLERSLIRAARWSSFHRATGRGDCGGH